MAKKPTPASAADPLPSAVTPVVAVTGSDKFGATIMLSEGREIQLGDAVRAALAATGLTAEAWNALEQPWRDAAIETAIEQMRAVPEVPQAPIADPITETEDVTVIMLTGMSGPDYSRSPGDEHNCRADEAERLIAAGFAVARVA